MWRKSSLLRSKNCSTTVPTAEFYVSVTKLLVDQNRGRPSLIAQFSVGVTKLLITYNILEPADASASIYPRWPAKAGTRQLKITNWKIV